jgi:predicted ATP-grasp superfamily ATP-dependent carboligase
MKSKPLQTAYPPVFVMNPYYSGIGIARNLHDHGVKVYGLSSEKNAPGNKSRFFDGIYETPDGRDAPEAFYRRLLEIREYHTQAPVIFPTRDFDVVFLHRYRERLTSFYRLPQPPGEAVPRVLDKFELTALASLHHISAPKTTILTSAQDIDKQVADLKFPLVVKPRFAYQWRQKGSWEKVGGRKAILVESVEQLQDEYSQLMLVKEEILVQEYVAGLDSDLVICGCYMSQGGELLGHFTAKKLKQDPPLFGTGCVVEVVSIPEIVNPSVELLKAFGYTGLAEIEFKYNKSTNTFFLIEINPRHWDQHELGTLVGVNLSWIAYQDIIGYPPKPQVPVYKESSQGKWIAEEQLVISSLRNIYRKIRTLRESENKINARRTGQYFHVLKKTTKEFFDLLRGQRIFAILHLRDPVPGLLLGLRILRDFSKVIITRVRTRFFTLKK